jgi:hypothetical protein
VEALLAKTVKQIFNPQQLNKKNNRMNPNLIRLILIIGRLVKMFLNKSQTHYLENQMLVILKILKVKL